MIMKTDAITAEIRERVQNIERTLTVVELYSIAILTKLVENPTLKGLLAIVGIVVALPLFREMIESISKYFEAKGRF